MHIYRIIKDFLDQGVLAENIIIITFNYDIYSELVLNFMNSYYPGIFCFPTCDQIRAAITLPSNTPPEALFQPNASQKGISILKMHGSLNWYSIHNSKTPNSLRAFFNSKRKINITQRKQLSTNMTYNTEKSRKTMHTFPIMVPPIIHKSGVLHDQLQGIWHLAEKALSIANDIVIFGYSCPASDIESANFFRRAVSTNVNLTSTSIIDPNGLVLIRYLELMRLASLKYFNSADSYLKAVIKEHYRIAG